MTPFAPDFTKVFGGVRDRWSSAGDSLPGRDPAARSGATWTRSVWYPCSGGAFWDEPTFDHRRLRDDERGTIVEIDCDPLGRALRRGPFDRWPDDRRDRGEAVP